MLSTKIYPIPTTPLQPRQKYSSRTYWKTLNLESENQACTHCLASGLLCPQNEDVEFSSSCGPIHLDNYGVLTMCHALINFIFITLFFLTTTLKDEQCYPIFQMRLVRIQAQGHLAVETRRLVASLTIISQELQCPSSSFSLLL